MPTLDDSDLIGRSPTVVGADTVDEAILIDIDSGYFFQLNTTAARIWALAEQPISFGEMSTKLIEAFKAPAEECRRDIAEFVADMQERGLLTVKAC